MLKHDAKTRCKNTMQKHHAKHDAGHEKNTMQKQYEFKFFDDEVKNMERKRDLPAKTMAATASHELEVQVQVRTKKLAVPMEARFASLDSTIDLQNLKRSLKRN